MELTDAVIEGARLALAVVRFAAPAVQASEGGLPEVREADSELPAPRPGR